jgi:lipopolysaccharide/colanic/teichoic acid biosynthesis glycosyltransferase
MAVPNDPATRHVSRSEHDAVPAGGRPAIKAFMVAVPDGSRHDRAYSRWGKRALDLVIAGVALVLALPILALAAVAVRLTMGGPVLFRQVRLGRDGVPFEVFKFRTMKPDRRGALVAVDDWDGVDRRRTHKSREHPLLTPVGSFMRRYSIDELPQVLNVLRGEMSIVGPRPELPSVAATYEPWQDARMLVRPGLTGLWQINARGTGPMHEAVEYDIEYLQQMGLLCDLRIVLATPKAMFGDHKGY